MRLVIQRVNQASVSVQNRIIAEITKGVVVFLAVAKEDTLKDADYLAQKLRELRLFSDEKGKMNLSLEDIKGEVLVVSQFTLLADCKDGRRPSFDAAAQPQAAEKLYDYFVQKLKDSSLKIAAGRFRAMMEVALVNDGPVTFIIDSKDA